MLESPLVTIVIPSYNNGTYLDAAIQSIFDQTIPVEVFVMDAGSTDNSLAVIKKWEPRLTAWRSHKDNGQAAAINEGIALGNAPYVCWLNSDDWMLANSLAQLITALNDNNYPAAYGKTWNFLQKKQSMHPVWVEPFKESRLALRCIISQPATLIRRSAWEQVGGLDENLHMAMDYDLWWRLYKNFGPLLFLEKFLAVNRVHPLTKTNNHRKLHYQEAIQVVKKHFGRVPWKWWLFQPYAVWFKGVFKSG